MLHKSVTLALLYHQENAHHQSNTVEQIVDEVILLSIEKNS